MEYIKDKYSVNMVMEYAIMSIRDKAVKIKQFKLK